MIQLAYPKQWKKFTWNQIKTLYVKNEMKKPVVSFLLWQYFFQISIFTLKSTKTKRHSGPETSLNFDVRK